MILTVHKCLVYERHDLWRAYKWFKFKVRLISTTWYKSSTCVRVHGKGRLLLLTGTVVPHPCNKRREMKILGGSPILGGLRC